jgi:AmpD protein
MEINDGWLAGARRVPSPNCDERPPGVDIELVVVHGIHLPPGEFGGPWVEALFTNTLDARAHPYFAGVAGLAVSSHLYVRRDGSLVQFVPFGRRAWHAGRSSWRGREACNDFSVGIELEGTDGTAFEDAQYASLAGLLAEVRSRLPLRAIAGHSDIAPGRKTDPGAGFDWPRLLLDIVSLPL